MTVESTQAVHAASNSSSQGVPDGRRPVRVRIAPSPTGDPHIGTAYMAVFNYLYARRFQGKFIIRIEDTDRSRFRADSEPQLMGALRWLGIDWDEGPDTPATAASPLKGPYRQSERLGLYREAVTQLVSSGQAYPCFCSAERLAELRRQRGPEQAQGYDGHCRGLDPAEAKQRWDRGEPCVVRLAVPKEGSTCFHDELRGLISFENRLIDDQVLLKSDGFPTYHLAVVVDDHHMDITHVIRGEEWITSTPKHILLYRAFGWQLPTYLHLPLLRNPDKSKISKRKNPTSILYYKRKGILPDALFNFLALMGYHPPGDDEKVSREKLIETFDPTRIHLGGPVFDQHKLAWLSGQYLRDLSSDAYLQALRSSLLSDDYLKRVIELMRERTETLDDFIDKGAFFFTGDLTVALDDLVPKKADPAQVAAGISKVLEMLDTVTDWTAAGVHQILEDTMHQTGLKARDLLMPIRMAVTGRRDSPPLAESMQVLGKEMVRKRLRDALELLAGAGTKQPS